MKVIYLPLEVYRERYTEQLAIWTLREYARLGVEYEVIEGLPLGNDEIKVGQVLDAYGRGHYACAQTANLIARLVHGDLDREDVIYFADMFHPGYAAIPYILHQLPPSARPRLFTRCWAQSVDPHDFTFPMRKWMRPFEMVVDKTAAGIFVGSTCHREELLAAGFEAPIYVCGLPVQPDEVLERAGLLKPVPWEERQRRVVFTSRWDKEKQPLFFLALATLAKDDHRFDGVQFAVTTSAKELRSNRQFLTRAAQAATDQGLISVYEGLSKQEYYGLLATSRVQFNCALQDYVSFTLLESSALGTPTLAPSIRSFPEALQNNRRQLYVAWSHEDALDRLAYLLSNPLPLDVVRAPVEYHRKGVEREVAAFRQMA